MAYELWRLVEKERLNAGLTKLELAQRSGVARTTINRLRSGVEPPSVKTVHALADALHIDRERSEILGGLQTPEPQPNDTVDVRVAIASSAAYTTHQRDMLLSMVDLIESANRAATNSGASDERRAI